MRSRWITPVLIAFAAIGLLLVITGDEAEPRPPLDPVTTEEGLVTMIPAGWVQEGDFSFEFAPTASEQVFDQWTVARACPSDGCGVRSLAEWNQLAPDLPTFGSLRDAEDEGVFDIEESSNADSYVMRASTSSAGRLVFVAHFADSASSYVACSARLALGSDERLIDSLVDVCRETDPVD